MRLGRQRGELRNLLICMVSRLGFEPRTLALKGHLPSLLIPIHSNKPHSYALHSPLHFGLSWGQSLSVHGQYTDTTL